jgi:hypothetical protein
MKVRGLNQRPTGVFNFPADFLVSVIKILFHVLSFAAVKNGGFPRKFPDN